MRLADVQSVSQGFFFGFLVLKKHSKTSCDIHTSFNRGQLSPNGNRMTSTKPVIFLIGALQHSPAGGTSWHISW
jgi:hypothetical protein